MRRSLPTRGEILVSRDYYESASDNGRRSIGYLGTIASSEQFDAVVHGVDTHWMSSGVVVGRQSIR